MFRTLWKQNAAVTLIELLAVIAIIGIIAGLFFANYSGAASGKLRRQARNNLNSMLSAARLYDAQHPPNLTFFRTNEDWVNDWKEYLMEAYLSQQPDSTPESPILTTGMGNKQLTYFFRDNNGTLQIVARSESDNYILHINWGGVYEEEDDFTEVCFGNAECFDGNVCTDDVCNSGTCDNPNNTSPCDDGDACTENDVCAGGSCGGTPVNCDDSNDCTEDLCAPETGCVNNPLENGASCNDGDLCTAPDQCSGGVCGGNPVDCSGLNDQCNVGVCNRGTGACEQQPANEGNACDDGLSCTQGETCAFGTCNCSLGCTDVC